MDDVNFIFGLFAFSLFISCLQFKDEGAYHFTVTKQQFYAAMSFLFILLSVIVRVNNIKKTVQDEIEIRELGFWEFSLKSIVYVAGLILLLLQAVGFIS